MDKNKFIGDYFIICADDGKKWSIPQKYVKTALMIYQPATSKGKIFKLVFPMVVHIPPLCKAFMKIMHMIKKELELSDELVKKIYEVFGVSGCENIFLSLYEGPDSLHKKTTIQIYTENTILGYCKFSKSNEVNSLFLHEQDILCYLKEKCVKNVPQCLLCTDLSDGTHIFMQSTIKDKSSKIICKPLCEHMDFLVQLYQKTAAECDYYDSDYCKVIDKLKGMINGNIFDEKAAKLLDNAINFVEPKLKNMTEFSAYHGDFTPWNCFVQSINRENQLFAFDFEYAQKAFPPMLDIFHFLTQICLYNGKDAANTLSYFQDNLDFLKPYLQNNAYDMYIQYLLAIISFYAERDGAYEAILTDKSNGYSHEMQFRLDLIGLLIDEVKKP